MKKTLKRRHAVHNDACVYCGTIMVRKRGTLRQPVNGESIAVPSVPHLSCPKCGEWMIGLQDLRRFDQDAIAIYRQKHGLLSADELRSIRAKFDLTQEALAELLHLGANTVSRW